jgi:hypothetical protein
MLFMGPVTILLSLKTILESEEGEQKYPKLPTYCQVEMGVFTGPCSRQQVQLLQGGDPIHPLIYIT